MQNERIFHGGRAGKGAVGFSNPTDRLVDPVEILLLASGGVLTVTDKCSEIDFTSDIFISAGGDFIMLVNDIIDISSDHGNINITATNHELNLNSAVHTLINNHGNGIDINTDGASPGGQLNMTGRIFNLSATSPTDQSLILAISGRISIPVIKTGATQGAAGAAATELWHCTTDHTIRIGI